MKIFIIYLIQIINFITQVFRNKQISTYQMLDSN